MGLAVFSRTEIANLLLCAWQAHAETMAVAEGGQQFHAGFRAAISSIALAANISPSLVLPEAEVHPQVRVLNDTALAIRGRS